MTTRKDGEETRRRILDSACQVFGEKGYRDATNAEICKRAGVNTAAINYHFRSKVELYRTTWEHTFEDVAKLFPLGGVVTPGASPEERLRSHIRTHLERIMDEGLSHFHRLCMREIFDPTGLVDDLMETWIEGVSRATREILRDLLGPAASEENIRLCEMSIISQCRMLLRPHGRPHRRLPWLFDRSDIDLLVDHITRFSLAGIEAVRKAARSAGAADAPKAPAGHEE